VNTVPGFDFLVMFCKRRHDTQHNDTQHNGLSITTLSIRSYMWLPA